MSLRGRTALPMRRRGGPMRFVSTCSLPSATAASRHPTPSLARPPRCSSMRLLHLATPHAATVPPIFSPCRFTADWAIPSSIFVRFQPTPNDACYKFYVDDMTFLPPGTHTMMFDSANSYQSPLAHTLLEALPMVEEVTVGSSFVTVRRVEEADAKAAARFFAMKFHGVQGGQEMDEAAAAARSQALQQHVDDVRDGERGGSASSGAAAPTARTRQAAAPHAASSPPGASSGFAAEAPIELGGFTVSPSAQDEQIDEAAIEALIAATDWSELKFHVSALLTDHISSGSPHVDPNAPNPHADTVPEEGDSEVVLMIKELVATTIRPQLQDDGGDLRFVGFDVESGEMRVELLGACRTCKSSKTTLVDLIERTTRHWIPEVTGVKDVSKVVSLYHRHAEEAVAEAESSLSVAELMQEMKANPSGSTATTEEGEAGSTSKIVQFPSAASAAATAAGGNAATAGYRIVREVKATAGGFGEENNAPKAEAPVAAATAVPSP